LGYVETTTTGVNNGGKPVLVRVFAPKGEEQHGEFALNVAAKALEYFAEGSKKFIIFQNNIIVCILYLWYS
jgi:hypothetical protein